MGRRTRYPRTRSPLVLLRSGPQDAARRCMRHLLPRTQCGGYAGSAPGSEGPARPEKGAEGKEDRQQDQGLGGTQTQIDIHTDTHRHIHKPTDRRLL